MKRTSRNGLQKARAKSNHLENLRRMRKASIILAVLATTLAGGAPLAQAQETSASQAQASSAPQANEQKGPTLGGHIGFVLPLVTHSGGQTTSLGDAPAVGFPTGITVKGSGPMAFDFEFIPQYNATATRQTSLTLHPGLIYGLGHGWAVGLRAAFVVDQATVGFTPLVNKSFPIKHRNGGLLKAYFVEADLPVRFSRPVGAPATNAVTFAMHFGVSF
jgi:hypothetical protein